METRFWKPSVTSQYTLCPIPYHMDTYRGCSFNCSYCFAREMTTFHRRNKEGKEKEFTYLVGNRTDLLKKWIDKTLAKDFDYNKPEEVALKERIPIKVGATSDPFPHAEEKNRITFDVLKVFEEYDYPLEIQTKNPEGIVKIMDEFDNPNWTIAVSLISTDEVFLKACEPGAPSAKDRLSAIKKLTDKGLNVMVKMQPAIYPKIKEDLPDLLREIKKAGCWSVNIEGLKVRISMSENEKAILNKTSELIGYDVRKYYQENGIKTGSDYELSQDKKLEYITIAKKLCKELDLKFFVADNHHMGLGCNSECCGTEVLRDYKIWGNNSRSLSFPKTGKESSELGKCKVNFTRSKKYQDKTIDEAVKDKLKKETP